LCGNAQNQANIWYFGTKAGLDFKQSPPTVLYNNILNASEGVASIADNNGKLLFYTNGIRVISRKHIDMKNGAGLLGDVSSTDNVAIIPAPGSGTIYYIFTIGSAFQANKGLRYSIIDMNGDGGFGEVTSKNILLEATAFEKLAAVRHCNKKDVWIVTHKWDSDEYLSFAVSTAGVNSTPVISKTNIQITGDQSNAIGSLKFSNNGSLLAAAHSYGNNIVELMQFDNTTGVLSNPVYFKPAVTGTIQNFTGVYGIEFSPNNQLLYVSNNPSLDDAGQLHQFDVSSYNGATIAATEQVLTTLQRGTAGALQLAPDNKIYMAVLGSPYLAAIDNPNTYGAGSGFTEDKIFIGQQNNATSELGLPHFMPSYFNPAANPYNFSRSAGNCINKNVQFTINRLTGIDSVKWDFGDMQSSQQLAPIHQYADTGLFTVQLIVYKIDCSGLNDTITKKIWIAGNNSFLGDDIGVCSFENFELTTTRSDNIVGINYLWNTGSTDTKTIITTPGKYWIDIDQEGCTLSDTITVFIKPKPVVNLGKDTTICTTPGLQLRANGGSPTATYLWSTGANTTSIQIFKPGIYSVVVTENTCIATDSIDIVWGDCAFYIPNAFTPNGDGVNDYFGVLGGFVAQQFSLNIYDRYGNNVYTTNNFSDKWDGTYKGKRQPTGAYSWSIVYINGLGYTKWLQGAVLLLH
jgi:gliding motility-associated-like protein